MQYILCKQNGDLKEPLITNKGKLVIFDNDIDANIERIYLQPEFIDTLVVQETKIGEK